MKKISSPIALSMIACGALLLTAPGAYAQGVAPVQAQSTQQGAPVATMPVATLVSLPGSIPVMTGGVGEGGQEEVRAVENNYSLKLVFAGNEGIYLSDVNVTIRDEKGTVIFSGATSGPVLLADLLPGHYLIEARYAAEVKTERVTIRAPKKLKNITIRYNVND